MTLFDYYARYMTELWEGKRPAPAGITLPEDGDEKARIQSLAQQLQAMGMAEFVRACAAQDSTVLPEELFSEHIDPNGLEFFLRDPDAPEPAPKKPATPDPDANKHAFEVFLDCIAMDDGLVQYLIDVLKRMDRKEFFKLSQITTKLDLDPEEFLYWLGNKELYADEEERSCAVIMDACLERLRQEGQLELMAALLSGDRRTFELFRCQAPELQHLPAATYEWYSKNYLDRDYPIRMLMKCRGIRFPEHIPGNESK